LSEGIFWPTLGSARRRDCRQWAKITNKLNVQKSVPGTSKCLNFVQEVTIYSISLVFFTLELWKVNDWKCRDELLRTKTEKKQIQLESLPILGDQQKHTLL
jgi:hypothetical protein